jgi:hypothetical protein
MILSLYRYRPVTVFGPPLPNVTVFSSNVTLPLPYRYSPLPLRAFFFCKFNYFFSSQVFVFFYCSNNIKAFKLQLETPFTLRSTKINQN